VKGFEAMMLIPCPISQAEVNEEVQNHPESVVWSNNGAYRVVEIEPCVYVCQHFWDGVWEAWEDFSGSTPRELWKTTAFCFLWDAIAAFVLRYSGGLREFPHFQTRAAPDGAVLYDIAWYEADLARFV
jgi:hypothetical protein